MSLMLNRSRPIFSSWIAVFAVLLNALAPAVSVSLSEARNPAAGGNWVEICSTRGSTWTRLGEEPADSAPEHCPYCFTHAASFGLPPTPPWVIPVTLQGVIPLPLLALPLVFTAWFIPAARAPPLHA